jgi:hypothetical protein
LPLVDVLSLCLYADLKSDVIGQGISEFELQSFIYDLDSTFPTTYLLYTVLATNVVSLCVPAVAANVKYAMKRMANHLGNAIFPLISNDALGFFSQPITFTKLAAQIEELFTTTLSGFFIIIIFIFLRRRIDIHS